MKEIIIDGVTYTLKKKEDVPKYKIGDELHNEYMEETIQPMIVNSDIPTVRIGSQEWMK